MVQCEANYSSNDSVSWAMIGALALGVAAAELHSPLAIDVRGLAGLALAAAALIACSAFYQRVRPNERLSTSCIVLLQALLFSAIGSILSYTLARGGGPFWDSTLYSWDQALGIDWLGYVRYIDGHGWLVGPLRLAYGSLIPQIVLVIVALGFCGKLNQLRTFVLAAITSGIVAILASPLVPAVSNYVHLRLTRADFQNVDPWAGYVHLQDLVALRSGQMGALNLPEMQGIITFPSYHASLATLTFWAFWSSGVSWLRWIGGTIALMTIAATPVDGGHYFVDVFAGIAIAVAALLAAQRLVRVRVALPRSMPSRAANLAPVQARVSR